MRTEHKLSRQLTDGDEDLLTEVEAHEQELPMSVAWYQRQRWLGAGPPYIRIANRIFYRRGDLREWVRSHRVKEQDRREDCDRSGGKKEDAG